MQSIKELVRNIAVVILLASFLELLLPNNSMRRFVQLIMGLFVLTAIVGPVAGLLHQPLAFEVPAWSPAIGNSAEQDIAQAFQQGDSIRQQSQQAALDQYKQVMQRQIKALALTVSGVKQIDSEVKLKTTGAIESLNLVVGQAKATIPPVEPVDGTRSKTVQPSPTGLSATEKTIATELRARLGALLGVPEAKITVQFAGN
ncbi:MAG: stage III sporulation protein AF [Peptococcaceae bacterium]|nr:stage III sporulation protein AF [Peptococcaceae bacterium]